MSENQTDFVVVQKNKPLYSACISQLLFTNILLNLYTAVKSS